MALQQTKDYQLCCKVYAKGKNASSLRFHKNFAGDCGSQIAWQGLLEASVKKGAKLEDTFVKQSWRLDTVEITY